MQPAYQQPEPEQRIQRMEARQARLDEVIPMAPPPQEAEEMEALAAEMEAGGNGPHRGRPQRPAPAHPRAHQPEGGPQRAVPVRQRQEVQEMLRRGAAGGLIGFAIRAPSTIVICG